MLVPPRHLTALVGLVFLPTLMLAEPKEPPVIKDLGENKFQIGEVQFNSKSKEITLETTLNLKDEVPLEYLLVTEKGKSHEALLMTSIRPFDLNVAFKLIGYKSARGPTRFKVTLAWQDAKGMERLVAIQDMIVSSVTSHKMDTASWTYGGSQVANGQFAADLMGDLISIQEDPAAIATYSGDAIRGDERWVPNKEALPKLGTKIKLTLVPERQSPHKTSQ